MGKVQLEATEHRTLHPVTLQRTAAKRLPLFPLECGLCLQKMSSIENTEQSIIVASLSQHDNKLIPWSFYGNYLNLCNLIKVYGSKQAKMTAGEAVVEMEDDGEAVLASLTDWLPWHRQHGMVHNMAAFVSDSILSTSTQVSSPLHPCFTNLVTVAWIPFRSVFLSLTLFHSLSLTSFASILLFPCHSLSVCSPLHLPLALSSP